jgi:hypothetical protein
MVQVVRARTEEEERRWRDGGGESGSGSDGDSAGGRWSRFHAPMFVLHRGSRFNEMGGGGLKN